MTQRNVQLSIDGTRDRPVGRIVESVQTGTNADLIRAVAPLYLTGSVLDMTYGRGAWWRSFTPDPFTYHDFVTVDGVDFRDLPHANASFDAVCFDPPYIPQGGTSSNTAGVAHLRDRFGLWESRSESGLWDELIRPGMAEACRVSRRWVLAKCTDYVNGGGLVLGHELMMAAGRDAGAKVHDLYVHHTGTGPGGHQITTVKRARRAHSYLIVFEVKP